MLTSFGPSHSQPAPGLLGCPKGARKKFENISEFGSNRIMIASYKFGPFQLDTATEVLFRGGEPVALGRRAVALLHVLVERSGAPVSKDELIDTAWAARTVDESNLTVQISALRRVLKQVPAGDHRIDTLQRRGYRFVGEVVKEENGGAAVSPSEIAPALALPDKPSIAVLPFSNLSGDPAQNCFADGLAQEIITALSHCPRLLVIACNFPFSGGGKDVDGRQVGREHGARYVLEGSIRRGGDRLRFTGQLIDGASGGHIWAGRFEGNMGDVLDLQDRLAEGVVAAIEPKLQQAEIERLKFRPASDPDDPYRLLLRAQQCEYQFRKDGHTAALRHLDQALAIDPSYAPAMALAALCYAERRDQSWMIDKEGEVQEGLRLASRAIELGKDDADVFWMAGYAVFRLQMDAKRARELVRHSLDLNPNSAIASAIAGAIDSTLDPPEGLRMLLRASRLNPRDPRGWLMKSHLAWAHLIEGQLDEAISAAQRVLNQNPRSAYALRFLAAGLAKRGQVNHAAEAIRTVLDVEPGLTLTKLRTRLMFIEENTWRDYSAALRIAGLGE
jgi:TolB-like protein